jgi:hypothetical protein
MSGGFFRFSIPSHSAGRTLFHFSAHYSVRSKNPAPADEVTARERVSAKTAAKHHRTPRAEDFGAAQQWSTVPGFRIPRMFQEPFSAAPGGRRISSNRAD